MLGEILGQMAQAVPGYVEGRQQAIKDNWQDLNNYNQVQAGQMNNLFTLATMPDRWRLSHDQRLLQDNAVDNSNMNTGLARQNFWMQSQKNAIDGQYVPFLANGRGISAMLQVLSNLSNQRDWVPVLRQFYLDNLQQGATIPNIDMSALFRGVSNMPSNVGTVQQ